MRNSHHTIPGSKIRRKQILQNFATNFTTNRWQEKYKFNTELDSSDDVVKKCKYVKSAVE